MYARMQYIFYEPFEVHIFGVNSRIESIPFADVLHCNCQRSWAKILVLSKHTTDLEILNGSLRSFKIGEKLYVGNTKNSVCMQQLNLTMRINFSYIKIILGCFHKYSLMLIQLFYDQNRTFGINICEKKYFL